MRVRASFFCKGFTLVELLVVTAIIAILIALLLPALKKVRQIADRTACAANMRTVAAGFIGYAHDNKGRFPAPAIWNGPQPHDWIYFHSGQKISQSPLWPYIGKTDKALRCPSGIVSIFSSFYSYSYAVNVWVTGEPGQTWEGFNAGSSFPPPGRLSEFKNISDVLMVVEPNSKTIFDGIWFVPTDMNGPDTKMYYSTLSLRHAGLPEIYKIDPLQQGLIHGVCIDGHYVLMPHRDAFHRVHYDPRWAGEPDREP
jgi:prepilin-type N-terminal cleavage/methylation domain-containing protein